MTIRLTDSPADLNQLEQLQIDVWGGEPVPAHQMIAAARNAGCVFVAELDDEIVGFCYGFSGGPYLVSHLLAVHPKARRRGLGAALKRAQWNWAGERGYEEMRWTFDPLRSGNAHLNLRVLGATAAKYYQDYYGEIQDELNAGAATDRLEIRWSTSPPAALGQPVDLQPLIVNGAFREPQDGGCFSIEIPSEYPEDKAKALVPLRAAFRWAFERGYRAVDFGEQGYLLKKSLPEDEPHPE